MSSLTATQWSDQAVAQLHEYEKNCSDIELFCVGYLIPLVALVETEYESRSDSVQGWHHLYSDYIEQCMTQDQMDDADQLRIRSILNWLVQSLNT